jgi:hypothetical protein
VYEDVPYRTETEKINEKEKVSNIYSAVEVWFGLKKPSYGNKCSGGGQPAVLTVFDFIFVLFFSI